MQVNNSAQSAASLKLMVLKSLRLTSKAVAHAALCDDQGLVKFTVQLGAQAAHVGFNHRGLGIEMKSPDMFEQHGLGDNAAAAAQEIFQELEFLGLQIN